MANTVKATLIPVSEIRKAPRGRKANTRPDLLEILSQVKPGFAADLTDIFGEVSKDERSKVSQTVRTHWKEVQKGKPSLNYSPEGHLQVSHSTREENEAE